MKLFLLMTVIGGIALWACRRSIPRLNSFLTSLETVESTESESPGARNILRSGWFWLGIAFIIAGLGMLESMQPMYFVQDDVRVGELPGTILGCRALMHGIVPYYNPYTLLGSPFASTGLNAFGYPPTIISYAVARYLLGNEYLMMDVFAALHIVAGYVCAFVLCRRLKMGDVPSCLASLSFVLAGSNLIMGRGWHSFIPIVLFMPLISLLAVIFADGKTTWRWTLCTALTIAAWFQVGFSQIWIYGVVLLCLVIIVQSMVKGLPLRKVLSAIPALIIGFALSLPLALQQFALTRGISRAYGYGEGIKRGLMAMLLPYPIVKAEHPNGWGSANIQYMGEFYFFGGLFALLLLANVLLLISGRTSKRSWSTQGWTLLALIVFSFCIGSPGPWSVVIRTPVIKHFNNQPFRLMPFFVLFAVISGGLLLERLLRLSARRKTVEYAVAAVALAVLFYHVNLCRPAFFTYTFPAYPELPASMKSAFIPADSRSQERAYAWATERSEDKDYVYTLNHDIPCVYNVICGSGYDPIVQERGEYGLVKYWLEHDPEGAIKAYGLKWHTVEPSIRPEDPNLPFSVKMETTWQYVDLFKSVKPDKYPVDFSVGDVAVHRVDGVDPLAFPVDNSSQALPFIADCRGVQVDTSSLSAAGQVVINFLWYAEIHAYADGTATNCSKDKWGRIVADVPSGTKQVTIRYEPKWKTGMLLCMAFLIVGVGAAFAVARIDKTAKGAVVS